MPAKNKIYINKSCVSKLTLNKIHKIRKSQCKSCKNKKSITKTLKSTPQQYFYSHHTKL